MPHDGSVADEHLQGRLSEAVAAGQLPGVHSALVILKGEILAEVHASARDERWGQPLGRRQHGPKTLHDLRSVTKSIVGLLYGIALDEGLVPGLDDPLLDQFSEYADLASDPGRRRILVHHALSMTMGTQWNEDLPYSDPGNSEIAMERASDRYRFILDRPMVGEPGAAWTYNGGATAIVARLIARGAGVPIATYARDKLFAPLGIENVD
jgi:CubicO group peptidase (beta-lactamase class C family)